MRKWAEGDYMPNLPTSRYGLAGSLQLDKIFFHTSFDRYLEQRYLGKNINPEPPMPAYSLLAGRVGYRLKFMGQTVECYANANNLLNVEARPQNSFLKYLAPLPGRNISLGVKVLL
ncbi:TonB-dependent receptor [Sphingobacterium spiritivorum]